MEIVERSSFKLLHRKGNGRRSSLALQIALYINLWLFPTWLWIIVVNLDAKYQGLTTVYRTVTVAVVSVLGISESIKLYLGYTGNLIGKIPELACCWLIIVSVQLPVEMFALCDGTISSHYSETIASSAMICLHLIETATGIVALVNLADHRAKTFYLAHLYSGSTLNRLQMILE